jgi:hypothetical protein
LYCVCFVDSLSGINNRHDGSLQVHGKLDYVETKLSDEFRKIAEWMKANKLTIHLGKTMVQLISTYKRVTKETKITIIYEGHTLKQVHSTKLLGIFIDSNLTWEDHYNYVCKKISQKIGLLKRIRDYMDTKTLKMLTNAIILPHMDYACAIWGRCPNVYNNVRRIEKLQKRAARVILNCKIRDIDSRSLFKKLNWMPFEDRVTYRRAVLMFKIMNNLAPKYLQNYIPVSSHSRNTRSAEAGMLRTERAELVYYTRSFVYESSRLWNDLNSDIKEASTIEQFKSRYLKDYFSQF